MRRAFIGLSSPLGYDYVNLLNESPNPHEAKPNPILESPYGLLLLFDEIIFLTRALCPRNMQSLPYVRFLDEEEHNLSVDEKQIPNLREAFKRCRLEAYAAEVKRSEGFISLDQIYKEIGISSDKFGMDNHSRGIQVGSEGFMGNPTLSNMYIDIFIKELFNLPQTEFITNTYVQNAIDHQSVGTASSKLAHEIIVRDIPNYLGVEGPYHPCIEEARDSERLKHFRAWLADRQSHLSISEIKEAQLEAETAIREAQDKIFLKYLDDMHQHKSIGKALAGDALGLLFPLAGTVAAMAEAGLNLREHSSMQWQGFVIETRRSMRR